MMKKLKCKFVVIGGGISGLTTAYSLSKIYQNDVIVIEKDSKVGGLCKTLNVNNSLYDLGSHRIHRNPMKRAFRLIREVCNEALLKNKRGGKLRIKNSYINYPIRSLQLFIAVGFIESFLCAVSLFRNKLYSKFINNTVQVEDLNYESYLIRESGYRVYRLFYEPYARKVWGCEPSLISITAVKKRFSMDKPLLFILDIIAGYLRKVKNNIYYYFEYGIGFFSDKLEEKITERGCKIYKNVKDFSVKIEDNERRVVFLNGEDSVEIEFDKLISTIPTEELVLKLNPAKDVLELAKKIKWRGLKLVYLHVKEEPKLEGETFYFPELKYIFGRISFPKRFSKKMQPDDNYTSIACEVPCSEEDKIWNKTDKEMYDLCLEDLQEADLISKGQSYLLEKNFVINIPKVYPLFLKGWKDNIILILKYLSDNFNYIYTSGKLGLFMHCNLDHSIDIGLSLAEYIKKGRTPKDWYRKINLFHRMRLRD